MLRFLGQFQADFQLKSGWIEPLLVGGYAPFSPIEAHVCICFIAYNVYKELERLIAINKIGMRVDKVLETAKTITTIRVRMPENGT